MEDKKKHNPYDNFKGKENTNGFDKNPENIGKGRKKKILTILKEQGFSKDDVHTAFKELIWYNIGDLKEVFEDKEKPIILRIVANQLKLALQKGEMNRIKEIVEHTIGRPIQKTDITSLNTHVQVDEETVQEIKKMFDEQI